MTCIMRMNGNPPHIILPDIFLHVSLYSTPSDFFKIWRLVVVTTSVALYINFLLRGLYMFLFVMQPIKFKVPYLSNQQTKFSRENTAVNCMVMNGILRNYQKALLSALINYHCNRIYV